MITTTRQIVWTPTIGPSSIAVALDPTFAKACREYALTDERRRIFATDVWAHMDNKSFVMPSNFLDFEQSLLIKGIYKPGGDGIWLTLDAPMDENHPFIYHGHNADLFALDRLWLLHAFSSWATGACALLDWY